MKNETTMPNNLRIDEEKYKSILKYIRLNVTEKIRISTGNSTGGRCDYSHFGKFQCIYRKTLKARKHSM